MGQVERHRPQGAGRRVDKVAARHILGVAAAAHENPAGTSREVQNGHLCSIAAAREGHDRKQHRPAAGQ